MIDVTTENLFPIREAAEHLPRRNRKKIHYSTVFRWVTRGCRGKRLETCFVGGRRYTSAEALVRFLSAGPIESKSNATEVKARKSIKAASDAVLAAEAKLDRIGVASTSRRNRNPSDIVDAADINVDR